MNFRMILTIIEGIMLVKMNFHYCFTVYFLIELENGKVLIGKNTDGEK